MNKENALAFIKALLGSYIVHNSIVNEICDLIAGSGMEQRFFNCFLTRLKFLSMYGINATQHEEFENIGDGLFSMHVVGKGFNIRILYSFISNRQPALLLAFYEREGKRATDYTTYIAPAKTRLFNLEEKENGEY